MKQKINVTYDTFNSPTTVRRGTLKANDGLINDKPRLHFMWPGFFISLLCNRGFGYLLLEPRCLHLYNKVGFEVVVERKEFEDQKKEQGVLPAQKFR